MKKDPAFLFYPSDFLTGTMFMSNEQIGIYIRLLCSQHQHGGIIDKTSFNSLVGNNDLLRSKFIECDLGFYNERLTGEMEKRNKKSNNISEAVKEVWQNRKKEKNAIAQKNDAIALQSHSKSKGKVKKNDAIAMGTVNRNEDVNIDYNLLNKLSEFFSFRKEMKKPILDSSKESFKKKLLELSNGNIEIAIAILEQSIANGWQGIFELKTKTNGQTTNTGKPVSKYHN